MWIVRLALDRPYTFVVLSLLILILSGVAIYQTPTDIFPNINIPVVGVVLKYTGLSPQDMQDRLASGLERGLTTVVSDIEHMEAQSYHGVVRDQGLLSARHRRLRGHGANGRLFASGRPAMPPGNAALHDRLQRRGRSRPADRPEQQDAFRAAIARPGQQFPAHRSLPTSKARSFPAPYGGKNRLVAVDLDPQKLLQRGLSGTDVVNAVNAQNLVVPQGTAKIGDREYDIALNSSAKTIAELNDVPVKVVNGAMVYLRDVAYVHDGASFQTNITRRDGQRGVLQAVLKHGKASTLDVVDRMRKALPEDRRHLAARAGNDAG